MLVRERLYFCSTFCRGNISTVTFFAFLNFIAHLLLNDFVLFVLCSVQVAERLLARLLSALHQVSLCVQIAQAPPELGHASIPKPAALALAVEELWLHLGGELHLCHAPIHRVQKLVSCLLRDLHRRQIVLHHVRERADDVLHLGLNNDCQGMMSYFHHKDILFSRVLQMKEQEIHTCPRVNLPIPELGPQTMKKLGAVGVQVP